MFYNVRVGLRRMSSLQMLETKTSAPYPRVWETLTLRPKRGRVGQ